jgi:RNA polymerase sigma-70 factor, ECF subfamily
MSETENFTRILQNFTEGKINSSELIPQIYDELHLLARSQRKRFSSAETLNTTALVHEAYLKMVDHSHQNWETRSHFFSVAAKAMRCILVDHAKMHKAAKRGGDQKPLPFKDHLFSGNKQVEDVLELDEALTRLENIAERQSKVIELRFFCGFTIEETAKILSLSPATVKRDWNMARSWLYREIKNKET